MVLEDCILLEKQDLSAFGDELRPVEAIAGRLKRNESACNDVLEHCKKLRRDVVLADVG